MKCTLSRLKATASEPIWHIIDHCNRFGRCNVRTTTCTCDTRPFKLSRETWIQRIP